MFYSQMKQNLIIANKNGKCQLTNEFLNDVGLKKISKTENFIIKDTLMQIWKFHYVCVHVKMIPWKFRIFNPRNSWVIYP